jgi:DNA mismatch repair protein MutL
VENALDAGARRIEVILAGGGIARMEVIDDGHGIPAGELALAIERHATSKLADDTLVEIATLGFRGEALPSIGAAARLTLISRPAQQTEGAAMITVAGGDVGPVRPAAGGWGTRAIVEDLFYATPARRKFLRSPRAEGDAAARAVWRLAMATPHVAFRLVADERVIFDLPAGDEAARLTGLFGRETAATMLAAEGARDGMDVCGFAGPASLSRATTALQSFVVNGRPVQDPLLRLAVRLAYRDVIPAGRHPVVALRLTLPASLVDVNVHPAKTELRFADGNAVRSLVMGALGRLLDRPITLAGAPPLRPAGRPFLALRPPAAPVAGRRGFAEAELALLSPPSARIFTPPHAVSDPRAGAPADPPADLPADIPDSAAAALQSSASASPHPLGAPVAQILETYVLAVAADGALVIIDQHAAHERLTEERLRAEFVAGAVATQPLLVPVVVDMAPADAARLCAQAETLARLGLEIEPFGAGAVLVRSLPAALKSPDAAALLVDLADEFAEMDGDAALPQALESRLDAALARMER